MVVKCEAMVEAGFTSQATESNECPKGEDSSAKTIEFLRARLLAERAASKSARQQAQDIAEKVKDLHARLETEIEHRKEAEAAVKKVFSVLEAKGVAVDAGNLLASTDLNCQPLGEAPSSKAYIEKVKEVSERVPHHTENGCIKEEAPLGNSNADTQKGIVECIPVGTTESGGRLSVVLDNTCNTRHGVESLDQDASSRCTPILKKDDVGTQQSIPQGPCITSKLKAMLQQIEEEVGALPEEQPLRDKLKGWVDHAATMLDEGKEVASNRGMEILQLTNSKQPHIDCPSDGGTALETKNVITHTQIAIDSKYAEASRVNEAEGNPVNQMHDIIAQGVDGRGGFIKSLLPAPKAQPPQRQFLPSTSTPNTPTSKDKLQRSNMPHQGKPPCAPMNKSNIAACVAQCPMPWPPQMTQYENSHSKKAASPSILHCSHLSGGNNYMGSESSYLVEVPSPKSFDALSIRNKMGYSHRQHHEAPARASELEGQNAWYPARLQSQPRAMLSKGYFSNELSNELLMQLERGYPHQSTHFRGGHSFSRSTNTRQAGSVGDYNRHMAIRQPIEHFPFDDAAPSVMNHRNGRFGSILMALDAARHHVQDDEFTGPQTPRPPDVRLKRGYGYEDHHVQQLPPTEFEHEQTWRSQAQSSHTPIIQFPPSPTSEHGYGYSPFERLRGGHRRSSSVSTNFMMSEWDNYMQPRGGGEVHLGNGITLFTD